MQRSVKEVLEVCSSDEYYIGKKTLTRVAHPLTSSCGFMGTSEAAGLH